MLKPSAIIEEPNGNAFKLRSRVYAALCATRRRDDAHAFLAEIPNNIIMTVPTNQLHPSIYERVREVAMKYVILRQASK